jgi:hypothetical protein
MTCCHHPTRWLTAGLLAGLAAIGASPARGQGADPAALRWTPHRAAVASVPPPTVGTAAAPATASGADAAVPGPPVGAPASVALPGYVPPPPGAPRTDRTLAQQRRTASAPVPWGTERRVATPQMPSWGGLSSVFGRDLTRAPQADMPRRRTPEWTAAGSSRAGRPERLAMNADGIPSVMTRVQRPPTVDGLPAPADAPPATPMPRIEQGYPAQDGPTEIVSMPGMDGMPSDSLLSDEGFPADFGGTGEMEIMGSAGPTYEHVESFFDDPYACEDDECMLPVWEHHGRVCSWLRQFGRPYYGWRWYRDFTASAGVMSFTNPTDLGINGNYGTNEYVNWAMPFWNAFGIGWQVGARATQANFNPTVLTTPTGGRLQTPSRNQVFVTTGFFTRAFEGRGLQGGAVYDYLSDSWFDDVDVSQLRTELSYVWGYHELGFWGAHNIGNEQGLFGPVNRTTSETTTLDLYTAFYRLQFGDANEWKFFGGGTGDGNGVVGSFVRAPMSSFWALEGTFTYIIPGKSKVIDVDGAGTTLNVASDAWNVGVNVVLFPGGRARRSLASPYRPLFEVADNGSMIRTIGQ